MKRLKVKEARPFFEDCTLRIYKDVDEYGEAVKVWEGDPEEITPYENCEILHFSGSWEPWDDEEYGYFGIYLV